MPGLIRGLDPERIARQPRRGCARRPGDGVEILAATKYVPLEEMGALAEAGVELVGENRLQDLEAKQERWGDAFAWDFIGNLQSRKVKRLLPLVPADPLGRHRLGRSSSSAATATSDTEVLIEVNVAGEEGKGGVAPGGARRASSSAARSGSPA